MKEASHCLTCDGEGRIECTRGYYHYQDGRIVEAERYADGYWYVRCRDCGGSGEAAEDPDRDSLDQLGLRGIMRTL